MRILVLTACALTLVACSKPANVSGAPEMRADMKPAPMVEDMANAPSAAAPAAGGKVAISAPMLAYAYTYGVAAAPKGVRELKARHEAACIAAGLTLCQVVSSNVSEQGADNVSAELVVRAAPAWLKQFRDGLAGETKAVGGRVTKTRSSPRTCRTRSSTPRPRCGPRSLCATACRPSCSRGPARSPICWRRSASSPGCRARSTRPSPNSRSCAPGSPPPS